MRIRLLPVGILLALLPSVCYAALEFSGYVTNANTTHFVVTDIERRHVSGWLGIGDEFAGYTLVAFDAPKGILSVRADDSTIALPLKPSRIVAKIPHKVRRPSLGPGDSASLNLPEADIETVVIAWKLLFGDNVTVADRAKSSRVSVKLPTLPRDELRRALISALQTHGVYVVEHGGEVIFDGKRQ